MPVKQTAMGSGILVLQTVMVKAEVAVVLAVQLMEQMEGQATRQLFLARSFITERVEEALRGQLLAVD